VGFAQELQAGMAGRVSHPTIRGLTANFHGERRSNETQSSTEPEAKLARKGPGKQASGTPSGARRSRRPTGACPAAVELPCVGTRDMVLAASLLQVVL
jgi:hypothetical protein